jgi:hypothetical protein
MRASRPDCKACDRYQKEHQARTQAQARLANARWDLQKARNKTLGWSQEMAALSKTLDDQLGDAPD